MKKAFVIFIFIATLTAGALLPTSFAYAATDSIISDSIFTNETTMTEQQVAQFIAQFPKSCLTPSNYPANLSPQTFVEPIDYLTFGSQVSPARVIVKSATLYHINPQVLLTTLEKEQNLITGNAGCSTWRYNSAMGYNCPDNLTYHDYLDWGIEGTCVERQIHAGFARQVAHAAWQFRFDKERAYGNVAYGDYGDIYYGGRMTEGFRARTLSGTPIFYDGYTTIDGQSFKIQNGATAALYNYTPHFNSFERIFTSWFGNTQIYGRVFIHPSDPVADRNGDPGHFTVSLNFRPQFPVTVYFEISDPDSLGVVGGATSVTIQPGNWNSPESNTVTVYGKDIGSQPSKSVTITTTDAASADPQFDLLTGEDIGDPVFLVQGGDYAVTRLYSPALNKHAYTARQEQINYLVANGYQNEGVSFYTCPSGEDNIMGMSRGTTSLLMSMSSSEYAYAQQNGYSDNMAQFSASRFGTVPIYRLINPATGSYFFTPDAGEKDFAVSSYGYVYEGIAFTACRANDTPIYRLFAPTAGHFYTADRAERDALGGTFKYEGPAFYTPKNETRPIYRLLNPNNNGHFYTDDAGEYGFAKSIGYVDENIGFTIPSGTTIQPVYRLYSSQNKRHFYTADKSERDYAVDTGYTYEGIAFYTH